MSFERLTPAPPAEPAPTPATGGTPDATTLTPAMRLQILSIGTSFRLDSSSYHDVICIIGMNRIRKAYLDLAPDLEPYFVMGRTDDFRGIETTMAVMPGQSTLMAIMAATPWLVSVLNSLLAGAIGALLAVQLGAAAGLAVAIGVGLFLAALAVHGLYTRRILGRLTAGYRPMFPGPDEEAPSPAE
jgi:hypothetical protein